MSNFPSKWYDFIIHKQLKKISNDLNNSYSLRIQIAASIIIAIGSFFLSDYVKTLVWYLQLLVYTVLSLIVVIVLLYPYLKEWILVRKRANFYIDGKDAVALFDDEIVYDVMVACEYFANRDQIEKSDISEDMKTFYTIEIEYYIRSSIGKLILFNPNYLKVFGNKKGMISIHRFNNIKVLIDKLIEKTPIQLDKNLRTQYTSLCRNISNIKQ